MNRHARREARRRGCLARYGARVESPAIHEPENCDGTCHAGELLPPGSPLWGMLAILLVHFAVPLLRPPRCQAAPAGGELCECSAHYWPDRPSRMPGGWERQLTPEQRHIHGQHFAWELALWVRGSWLPDLAELRVNFRRALDRKDTEVAARARALARVVFRPRHDHGPPSLGGITVLCHPQTGPPARAAASEAPVICP